jgi:RNA polymerase sigma-70 factor (ECF subfamily)
MSTVRKIYAEKSFDDPGLASKSLVPNESLVWEQFCAGEEEAFVYIYKAYFNQLYQFAFQFSSDEDFIKDQIQDLFIYIRERRKNLKPVANLKLYLFVSLKNRILRSIKALKYTSLENAGNFLIQSTPSCEEIHIDSDDGERKEALLQACFAAMTPKQREAIVYFYYESFNYAQIAELMGYKNAKQVRKLIYRAVDTLRLKMAPAKKILYSFFL